MKTKLALEEPKGLVYCNFKSFNSDYVKEESSKFDLNNKEDVALRITLCS